MTRRTRNGGYSPAERKWEPLPGGWEWKYAAPRAAGALCLQLSRDTHQHNCPTQDDCSSPQRRVESSGWCCYFHLCTSSCEPSHYSKSTSINPKNKFWHHCQELEETVRKINSMFIYSSVFVSRVKNHRIFSCQTIFTDITERLGFRFEIFGFCGRGGFYESFSLNSINLNIWKTKTTKAPERLFFQTLQIFTIHLKSKCFY